MNTDQQHVIHLTNYIFPISDVDEIYDETEVSITLAGYFDGAAKTIMLTGEDARTTKAWLDADHQRWVEYQAANGVNVVHIQRGLYAATTFSHVPIIEHKHDLAF